MSISDILHQFATDTQTKTILLLIGADLILGVLAAFKAGTFKLTYVANFARNDLLGKVVPFFAVDALAMVAGSTDVVIPGLDLSIVADGMFVAVTAAMVGSLVSSLTDLGVALPASLGRGTSAADAE